MNIKKYSISIAVCLVCFALGGSDENIPGPNLKLMDLRREMMDLSQKTRTPSLTEYFIVECKDEAFRAKVQKAYFPLYEEFVEKFYDPQCLLLNDGWDTVRYFSGAYSIYSDSPKSIDFKEKSFLANLLLHQEFDKIERLIKVQKNLESASFELHLTGAVAAIRHKNDGMQKCLEYALNKHPAKALGMIQWFAFSGGFVRGRHEELFEMIEQNPHYLNGTNSMHIFGLLHPLIVEEAKTHQFDEKITILKLREKKIYQLLTDKLKGRLLTITKVESGFSMIMKNEDNSNDFILEIIHDSVLQ